MANEFTAKNKQHVAAAALAAADRRLCAAYDAYMTVGVFYRAEYYEARQFRRDIKARTRALMEAK